MRVFSALVIGAILTSCASAPSPAAPVDPAWRARVASLVEAWPADTYAVFNEGVPVGEMTLRQRLVEREGETFLLLEDAARVEAAPELEDTLEFSYTARCRLDDHLTPVIVESRAPLADGGPARSQLVVRGGRAMGTTFESDVDLRVPPQFVIRQALMRLVTLLPRRADTQTRLAFLSLGSEPRLEPDGVVRCIGRETLEVEGRARLAWRFEYVTPGAAGATRPVALWVGEDDRFLRFHDAEGLQLVLRDAGAPQAVGDGTPR